jgi:ABC-type multidrug transport system fused ATPase/permease subunit
MSMMGRGRRGAPTSVKDEGPKAKFSQLWPYLMEHKPALWFAVILSLLSAVVNLGQPLIVGQLIEAVQQDQDVTGWAVGLIAVLVGTAVTGGLMYYVLAKAGEGVVLSARNKLATRLLRLPIKEYDLRRTGDLVSRVGSDTTLLRAVLTQGFVDAAGGILIFVGSIVAMAIIDPLLLGITLAVIAIAIAAVAFTTRQIKEATTKAQSRVGDMAASVERALSAVRTIRASRAETREADEINKNAQDAYTQGVKIAKLNAAVTPIAGIAFQGAFIAVLGVGGYRVASGETSIANLITFILLMFTMSRPLGQAFGAYSSIQSALGALARIQEVLDIGLEETNEEQKQQVNRKGNNSTAIEFRKVSFSYDEAPVLSNVSFKIERGTRVAIVGPSGSGKSTTFSLIERFYEPTSGQIFMDGQAVTKISRDELRAQIGYVEQDAPVLAGSIKDNLLIGKPNATDKELKAVLAEVNLTDVLKRDKRGLKAEVGENGIMLSGGERQRLAIARALLAAPPILLLDESTASLDGLNEQRMREALDAVAKNRTVIVIAHRLSTVVDSDQIIVMEQGKVIGAGKHKALLKSTPLYKELAATQMLD